jgi:hypothetical protein
MKKSLKRSVIQVEQIFLGIKKGSGHCPLPVGLIPSKDD